MLRGDHERRDSVVLDDGAARDALLLDGLNAFSRNPPAIGAPFPRPRSIDGTHSVHYNECCLFYGKEVIV